MSWAKSSSFNRLKALEFDATLKTQLDDVRKLARDKKKEIIKSIFDTEVHKSVEDADSILKGNFTCTEHDSFQYRWNYGGFVGNIDECSFSLKSDTGGTVEFCHSYEATDSCWHNDTT